MNFKVYEVIETKAEEYRQRTRENKQKVYEVFTRIKESQYFNLKLIAYLAGVYATTFNKIDYYQLKKEIMSHANYRRHP